MPDRHAVLNEDQGRFVLVFERVLPYPPARVWRALTERSELQSWHPTPFDLEPRAGGRIEFEAPASVPEMGDGRIIAIEEPRLLCHTWFGDELRWELSEHPRGCRLTLSHFFDDRLKAARDGAGWHVCLRALETALAGAAQPARGEGAHVPDGWSELNGEYQQRFGISPDEATPPPSAPPA
jgi:uncharacterized protein YndB with AHSA1/START domain